MRKTALAGLLLLPAVLMGQPKSWTLQECIDYALDHNITVKQSEISTAEKEIALNTAENSRLPGVAASAGENLSFGRGLTADNTYANTNTTSSSFSLGGSIPVFQGFEIRDNIRLSKLDLAASMSDLEKAKDDIRVAVAQAYVQILYSKEILRVAEGQVAIDSQQLERIEAMKSNGKASAAQVAAQQATLAQSRLSETQAANNLRIALLDLTQLLELPSPEGFDVVVPSESALQPGLLMNPEDIFMQAEQIKPAVQSEKIRLDYMEQAITRAKGAYLPTISLNGGIGTNFYTSSGYEHQSFGDQVKNNFSQYVALSLNIPIFSKFATRNSVRTAQLNFNRQQLQLENVKKSLYKEIQQAYYNAVTSQEKARSSTEAAASAKQAFELEKEKYENGKSGITEYNESKNRWMEAESNLLQARYESLYQEKLLDFYRGEDLSF